MRNYMVTNKNGLSIEVNENELYKIGEYWVDDWNEFQDEGTEWHYPNGMSDIEEIMMEFMQCEIEEIDDEEIESDTMGMYLALLG